MHAGSVQRIARFIHANRFPNKCVDLQGRDFSFNNQLFEFGKRNRFRADCQHIGEQEEHKPCQQHTCNNPNNCFCFLIQNILLNRLVSPLRFLSLFLTVLSAHANPLFFNGIPFRRGDSRIARSHAPFNRSSSIRRGWRPTARSRFSPRSPLRHSAHTQQIHLFVIQSASEESGNSPRPTRLYPTEFPFRGGRAIHESPEKISPTFRPTPNRQPLYSIIPIFLGCETFYGFYFNTKKHPFQVFTLVNTTFHECFTHFPAVFVIQSASEESGNPHQPTRFFSNRTPSVGAIHESPVHTHR